MEVKTKAAKARKVGSIHSRCNAMLKQDLINRGATAYEIAQIVGAGDKLDKKSRNDAAAMPMQKAVY